MDFSTAYHRFQQSLDGTDSYVALSRDMQALMTQDAQNASLYYTVYRFARQYVLLYEDQAIDPDFAQHAKRTLAGFLATLEAALNGAEAPYSALNRVVTAYLAGDRIF
ncbi:MULTISPECIES: hypothetical protein [Edwardsiella]|uniref:Uncharacterized protein n=1 Tax=Edwardsiella anguillarum TaxID=1821960 RepID=A0ABY8SL09_9GAMM|nr:MULTISPECIES: hypothetical protein [Edwardsiella]AKM48145.1 hypothetical protein QY76_13160 [Edwardsiella sp. EA181011]GAJ66649.1 hypothetical protein MA13_contig00002-0362 [Edwardsiella piscicida]AKR77461.1 hypothetical protein AAZ33_07005 [Edwardsiella sp. LADL05-105]KAB0592690.1 hypothetical protein F7P84_04970 [Edwardsiella anguillarum]RFT03971.1 hypothetical protein CGL57_09580 [Edwardsiella anguillarum]